jgi:hypothetical protein
MPNPGFDGPDDPRFAGLEEALERAGGIASHAAKSLGIPGATFDKRLAALRAYREASPGQQESIDAARLDGLTATGGWIITDKDGEIIRRSTRWKADDPQNDPERILDAIKAGLADMPPAAVVPPVAAPDNLCAIFPVADLHVGMLADSEEVGADWDTKIARRVFEDTFARIVSMTPPAGVAVLAQLGDLTHSDDQRNITPQSGHQLDVDSRYFLILRRAVAAMKAAIEALRLRYPLVIYRGCRGNHDITAHYAVTLALAEHYRDVPGVRIIDHAGEFFVHEFGVNMVLLHHGDRAKPERLVHFAAAEWPDIWGRTRHRVAFSGHVHHARAVEVGGMAFESIGTIIPRDAYAYSHAYSARRALVSITLDREQGEVSRARVNL